MSVYSRATPMIFSPDGKVNDWYWVMGDRRKPVLLLIPGFTGLHSDLLGVGEVLKEKFFVIIPELPGWGESPRFSKRLSMHNYARYLKALLEDNGVSHIILVGHCMGAALAIEIAYLYPHFAKKLILISTPYRQGAISQQLFLHLADMSMHVPKRLRSFFFLWRSRIIIMTVSYLTLRFKSFKKSLRVVRKKSAEQPFQHEDTIEENWVSLVHFNYNKGKKIKVPIHLIHGEKDLIVSKNHAIQFAKMLPHATLDFISQAGHIPPEETPRSLATLIEKLAE